MTGIVLVVLLLGVSTAVAANDTVTRTLQATASPGDTLMVSLEIDFEDQAAVDRLVITEAVPDGWAVVDASNSGNFATAGKIIWMLITAIGGTIPEDGAVFTYNVTVPADASGVYSFPGVYGTNVAGTGLDILGDVNVTIDGDELLTLVAYTITNRTITPPQTTSIDVAFSEYVSATINIENASGNLVNELYSSLDVKNPNAKVWDGTYTDGTSVPDGTYTVNVTGVNTTTGLSVINTSETITVLTSGAPSALTVTANTPTGTDVAVSTVITATFSEAMNQTSVEAAFSISPAVNGSLGWDGDMVTFTPDADLAYSTAYEVTIGAGAEAMAGNALAADCVWSFTTVAEAGTIAPTVTATLSPNTILSDWADSTILEVHASSENPLIGIASVTVNLSAIGGLDEQELQLDGTQIGGIGTWNTTISTTSVGTFDLTVTVTNDAGDSATADVTLTTGPYQYTLELKKGWNMISLPYNVAAVGIDTTQKLGDLITNAPDATTSCHYVARYNATLPGMECDLISEPQDTSYPILGGQAYFVFVWDDKDVAVVGTLW